jgi:hypothetical protein
MPFVNAEEQGQDPEEPWWQGPGDSTMPEVVLRQVGPNAFQMMKGFRYEVPATKGGDKFDVPRHNVGAGPEEGDNSTDLASVPQVFWWFIASGGQNTRAALLHDYLVDRPDVKRRRADEVFRFALTESRVGFVRRWLMWTAVSFVTWLQSGWRWRFALLAFVLYFVAFVASIVYYWPVGGDWSWLPGSWSWLEERPWVPALIIGLFGFLWGHRWPFTLFAFAMLLVPTVYAVVATYFVDGLDRVFARIGWTVRWIQHRFSRRRNVEPPPPYEPPQVGPKPNQALPF